MVRGRSYENINDARAIMRSNYRNMPSGCVHCKYKTSGASGSSDCKVCSFTLMKDSGHL
ncbi:hypothetical protein [Clostridium cylindrosporum]|uniref:Uncharacterized protein n=1 Tax=Clostridium cylindrosporum DSM 605 TaxID=1121307 RepID=A0A0J8D865_CLOCY|nr:hypothetical protein [Clostridium cylindrosporum]KMT22052.1 hypothetical protein CLCY_4c00240 [Clostridium cylindrosporum DSM 605]